MSDELSVLKRRFADLETKVRRLEKKQKEQDAFFKKLKSNTRLFFQRLRSQLDFKF